MEIKEKQDFINFWEFLEIPMNSPTADIKLAFLVKLTKIEESIDKGDCNYTPIDLKNCVCAYETLSDPYKRFLHNCEIDGEEPPQRPDWGAFFDDYGVSDYDLSDADKDFFLSLLLATACKYKNINNKNKAYSNDEIKLFMEVANSLFNLYGKEQEKKLQKENKKNIQHVNKKALHN